MHTSHIAKIIAGCIILTSYVVMIGTFLEQNIIRKVFPFWEEMSFGNGVSFFCAGVILYAATTSVMRPRKSSLAEILLPASILIILLIMATFLTTSMLQVGSDANPAMNANSGMLFSGDQAPSLGTMLTFLVIALVGINAMLQSKHSVLFLRMLGLIVLALAAVAIAGYVTGRPHLYFDVQELSKPMHFNTSVLFACVGIGLLLSGFPEQQTMTDDSDLSADS